MPQYAALLYRNESETPPQHSAESKQLYQAWAAFRESIGPTGVLKLGHGLAPASAATTVRVREGKTLMTDGPFAETKEQLGGVFILECADLDEALQWASQIPDALSGSVEVRPLWGQ